MKTFVEDLDPGGFTFSFHMDPNIYAEVDRVRLDRLTGRREQFRAKLSVLSVAHPSRDVLSLMNELDKALDETLSEMDNVVDHPHIHFESQLRARVEIDACYRRSQELLSAVPKAY